MTLKFNFYDIYGFALPGFLLLAVLWLPFGVINGDWPDAEFSSALLGVIIAYIAGHVLQTIAQNAIPSNFLGGRYPSSVYLDKGDPTFSEEFKNRLRHQIQKTFELDVSDKKVHRDAFFLCRSALIKSKSIVYPEQFEGLYALMRGLCAAFGIAVVYYLGWAYSGLLHRPESSALRSGLTVLAGIFLASLALVTADRFNNSRVEYLKQAGEEYSKSVDEYFKRVVRHSKSVMIVSLFVAMFALGYYLGLSSVKVSEHRGQLIAVAVFSFFASERCYSGYKYFAQEFAKSVYRDFSNYEKPSILPDANARDDAEDEG